MTVPVPGMYLSLYCTRYGTRYQTGERQDDIRIPVPVPVFYIPSFSVKQHLSVRLQVLVPPSALIVSRPSQYTYLTA